MIIQLVMIRPNRPTDQHTKIGGLTFSQNSKQLLLFQKKGKSKEFKKNITFIYYFYT